MNVIALDEQAAVGMESLISGIAADRWTASTPCPEWTVRDLVAHIVAGNVMYHGIAGGDDFQPGAPEVEIGDDPAATYRRTVDAMLEAWRLPGALDREIGLPRGQRGRAEVALWMHLAETLGHGWDLARAAGQKPPFDDDVVEASLLECQRRMPAERVAGMPFTSARSFTAGSAIDRLAAYLGRDPEAWAR